MTFTSTYGLDEFGNETSLSQSGGVQRGASLIGLENGTSAVFYHDVATGEIAARLVAADGTPGARIVASSGSIDFQNNSFGQVDPVSVAKLNNGNIVLTWASNEPTKSIYYRIFDPNLNPLTAATLAEGSAITGVRPDVAALAGGGFVIVWEKQVSASDVDPVYRRFDAAGTALDSSVGVALDLTATVNESPSVAGLADGGFAVGWHRRDAITFDTSVYFAVRNADGTVRIASTLQDSTGTINRDVDVVARSDGGFTLFYEDTGWSGPDSEITAANYNAAGNFQQYRRMTNDGSDSTNAAAAVSSEGFVLVTQDQGYFFPTIHGSLLAPDGSVLFTDRALSGTGDDEEVSNLAWLDPTTVRITYRGNGSSLGDDSSSVNSRTFHLVRTTTADAANDVIDFSASAVRNIVYGGDGDDVVTGGAGNDILNGQNNNDTLNGGAGDDTLAGGNGLDMLNGGDGDDTFVIELGQSGATISGGAGFDTILGLAGGGSVVAISGIEAIRLAGAFPGGALTLTGNQIAFSLPANLQVDGPGYLTVNMNAGVAFTSAQFIFTGGFYGIHVNGTSGSDSITAGSFDHSISGLGGIDTIIGGSGDDTIGLIGSNTGSFIHGGAGTGDLLDITSGAVALGALSGIEAIRLAAGAALTLTGTQFSTGLALSSAITGSGNLIVNMSAGEYFFATQMSFAAGVGVTVNGTSGIDVIKAALGAAITINGGDEIDQIRGSNLADTILGGDGNDKIIGLGGADVLTGGLGADQFRYLFAADSGLGAGADQILDFTNGSDKLDFRVLDADPNTAGRQALSFIGNAVFATDGSAQVRYVDDGADTRVEVDLNGDGAADMHILLFGHAGQALAGSDFML